MLIVKGNQGPLTHTIDHAILVDKFLFDQFDDTVDDFSNSYLIFDKQKAICLFKGLLLLREVLNIGVPRGLYLFIWCRPY